MIPTHRFSNEKSHEVRVIKLGSLSNYNITEPHRHDYIELFVFDNGGGIHEIDFTLFDVESKSIHIVAAGRVHQMKRALNSNGYVILFHPSIFENDRHISEFLFDLDCYDVTEMSPCFKFQYEDQLEVMRTTERLWSYSQSHDLYRENLLLMHINLLCIFCMRTVTKKENDPSKDQFNYTQFRKLLSKDFKSHKTVKYYADQIGITARKLNEIVLEKAGMNVRKLIQKQIILEAKRLLNSGLPSKEIAYELSFDDPAHFSKFFKNQTGITPSAFQNVHD